MLDRDLKFDRSKAIERSAHLKDITDRARAATPVNAGKDVLAGYDGDGRAIIVDMRTLGGS